MDQEKLLFSNWLEELAGKYGDDPAIICGRSLSFSHLCDTSRRFALVLAEAGVQQGDKVVLWAFNSAEWLVAFFGITMAGGAAALVNYSLIPSDVTKMTKLAGAKWALIGNNKVSIRDLEEAKQAVNEGGVDRNHVLLLSELFEKVMDVSKPLDKDKLNALTECLQPEDTACIIFTTGTTSNPKGVQLSSKSLLGNAKARSEFHREDFMKNCCVALPLFHSYGLVGVLYRLNIGVRIYLVSKIKPELVMDLIVTNKIETITTVGAIFSDMSKLPNFEEKLRGMLKVCVLGGGFTSPAEIKRLENALDCKVLMGYGMTECSSVISCNVAEDPLELRSASVGYILPNISARIWIEGKGAAEAGEIGELIVKGPGVMNGYLGLPKEQQPVDEDGWLHTGDLAKITETGMLILAGRLKDIIVRKGENISPLEVEKILLEELPICDAKVFGAPHPIWGESVEACVIFNGEAPDEEILKDLLSSRLAKFKIPSHFFVYSAFPRNANGKLDQRRLKEDMLEKLKALSGQ